MTLTKLITRLLKEIQDKNISLAHNRDLRILGISYNNVHNGSAVTIHI